MASTIMLVTLGFGSTGVPGDASTLPLTLGFGAAGPLPTGIGHFCLDSVYLRSALVLRVRFTAPPATTGPSVTLASVAANYLLTGPGAPAILTASPASDDDEVADLHLSHPLGPGVYTLEVARSILGEGLVPFTGPNTVTFEIRVAEPGPLSGGGVSAAVEAELLGLTDPAYAGGTVWRAVLGGFADALKTAADFGLRVFDQLWIPSASGKYLEARAADQGVPKAVDVGLRDTDFRRLVLRVKNLKLTQLAFNRMLEVFYGRQSVSAYVEATAAEPYVLTEGEELVVLLDETAEIRYEVRRRDYRVMRRATSDEVAAELNRLFTAAGNPARAEAAVDAYTGARRLRIYSGAAGLGSAVRVTGGRCAAVFRFPEDVLPLPEAAVLPEWTVTPLADGTARYSADSDASVDLSEVVAGDFVVVSGFEFADANRGWWPVLSVHYSYTGPAVQQYVVVANPAATSQSGVPQLAESSVKFFRPVKRRPQDALGWVSVDQRDGDAEISIPVTTTAVRREANGAAYLQPPVILDVDSASVDADGTATVTTAAAHGVEPGDQVELLGFRGTGTIPTAAPGTAAGAPTADDLSSTGTSGRNAVTAWHVDSATTGSGAASVNAGSSAWIVGGRRYDGLGNVAASRTVKAFRADQLPRDAHGVPAYRYRWSQQEAAEVCDGQAAAALLNPASAGGVAIAGGYDTVPWDDKRPADVRSAVRRLDAVQAKEVVLVDGQLTSGGLMAALGFQLTALPPTGSQLTVRDAAGTRVYVFGSGAGDVVVTIGVTVAATMTNLASAIAGDGPARWSAQYAADRTELGTFGTVGIWEKTVTASRSTLRLHASSGLAAVSTWTRYGTALLAAPDYSAGSPAPTPTTDPGAAAGMHRLAGTLQVGEVHGVLAANPLAPHPAGNFWRWTGAAWSDTVQWFTVRGSASATAAVAEPGLASTATSLMVVGGSNLLNTATNVVSVTTDAGDPAAWSFTAKGLLEARSAPRTATTSAGILVSGGRQPANGARRVNSGFTGWSFDDAYGAANFQGMSGSPIGSSIPLPVAGNRRVPGKIGFGVLLTNPMIAALSGGGVVLNSKLADTGYGYSVSVWMTAGQGAVFRNAGTTASATNNTLLEFGVDPADDKFYVTWDTNPSGSRTTAIVKTTATMTSVWGPPKPATPFPHYHHVGLTVNTAGGFGTRLVTLYINGVQIQQWSMTPAGGGTVSTPGFGATTATAPGFTGAIDEFAMAFVFGLAVADAQTMAAIYRDEVGVSDDSPLDLDQSPVGRVMSSCELLDSAGNAFRTGPMGFARFAHTLTVLPDGRVLAVGGVGYPAADLPSVRSQRQLELRSCEVWDPATGLWGRIADTAFPHSYGHAAVIGNQVYVAGGFTNAPVEYLDLDTMQWSVSTAGAGSGGRNAGGTSNGVAVWDAGHTSTVPLNSPAADRSLVPAAESVAGKGIDGWYAAAPGTTGSTLVVVGGAGTAGPATGGEVRPARAEAGLPGMPGPRVWDPRGGMGISSVASTTVGDILAGRPYVEIELPPGDAEKFPDSPGFLVMRFGRDGEVGPVPYSGRIGDSKLAVSPGFKFSGDLPSGSRVVLLATRGPFVPETPETAGSFYVTDSPAGRAAATEQLREISAAGIDLHLDVRYPGPRGIGAEEFSTRGSEKLSDNVPAFAHRPDEEVAAAVAGDEVL